ncbi:MAG TPA: hypothetical protein VE422_06645 [Terriglobia bacterium]|nr:hypothetical protein [Terriglobia bacterium]
MRIRKDGLAALAAVLLVLSAAPLMAQHAGFRIGIAPTVNQPMFFSGFGQPVVLPFQGVPITTFGAFPAFGFQPAPMIGFPGVSTFGFPQTPAIVTRVVPGSVVFPQQVIIPGSVVVPGSVVIPGSVAFPGSVFGPTQVFTQGSVFIERPQSFPRSPVQSFSSAPVQPFSNSPVQPFLSAPVQPFLGSPVVAPVMPPVGTPRGEVLNMLGQPTVTVITSTGETMHFTGGVTVQIQNGQVAGPR